MTVASNYYSALRASRLDFCSAAAAFFSSFVGLRSKSCTSPRPARSSSGAACTRIGGRLGLGFFEG